MNYPYENDFDRGADGPSEPEEDTYRHEECCPDPFPTAPDIGQRFIIDTDSHRAGRHKRLVTYVCRSKNEMGLTSWKESEMGYPERDRMLCVLLPTPLQHFIDAGVIKVL